MTEAKAEHKTRLVHNWVDAEESGFRCAPGNSAFSRDDAEKTCRGCGAVVSAELAAKVASAKNGGRLSSWVIDKAYHDFVDPCGCVRCAARNAAFWPAAGDRERMTVTTADVGTIEAAELLGGKKAKK